MREVQIPLGLPFFAGFPRIGTAKFVDAKEKASIIKHMSMKNSLYRKPLVTRIKLDPRQAVLTTCSNIEPMWMSSAGSICIRDDIGPQGSCNLQVRGVGSGSGNDTAYAQYTPS